MSFVEYLKDKRIMTAVIIVVALAALDLHYGVHFGIEFVGGTQIPITLEHAVNLTTMSSLLSDLQQRVSTFGLKQVTVEGVGNSHVYVIVPTVVGSEINQTLTIIQSQGNFEGVVSGKEAVNGSGIISGSIGEVPPQILNNTVSWAVTFYLTQSAAARFADIALGQGNQPLYMFLDRPSSTVLVVNATLLANASSGLSQGQALAAMQKALSLGNATIPVIAVSGINSSISSAESFLKSHAYKSVIASRGISSGLLAYMQSQNYSVKLENNANMSPTYTKMLNGSIVDSWPAVGLLSSPILSPGVTNGNVSQAYQISGYAPTSLAQAEQITYAQQQSKDIASILSGGALPVSIIAGTPTTIPPTLGGHFLYISGIIGLAAVLAISALMTIRYRRAFLVAPILLTTFMELFIIFSIIGLVGTIDLAAVAGMIAVVGTGVDAQIIITDEILTRRSESMMKTVLGNAFYIIWTDALLLVIAMMPLFFSTSLVEVIGFSESTIIGALLGVIVTRPAYSAIVSRHYGV
jgi:preprotein translocase subunit SecD